MIATTTCKTSVNPTPAGYKIHRIEARSCKAYCTNLAIEVSTWNVEFKLPMNLNGVHIMTDISSKQVRKAPRKLKMRIMEAGNLSMGALTWHFRS